MRSGGLAAGRILGIRILIHPSWFIIFALVVLSLVTFGTPAADVEALSLPARWLVALIGASLFFASVIVHELAHAVVARRRGVQVNEITLFIFGGAANMEQEAPDPRTEALISVAGPIASILVAIALMAGWLATQDVGGELVAIASLTMFWLGISNLMLAIFNLIPGFPMDGGRLLRALVWAVTRDFVRATRIATLVGRAFAYALIAFGFVLVLNDAVVEGIWLAFIGWFLNQAAESSYRRVEFERLVEGIRVRDVMDREVPTIGPNLTIDTLVDQHLLTGQASLYPVTMDGDLMGTIEIGQVSRIPRNDWPMTRVTDVMTRGAALVTLTEPQSLMDAVGRFEESGLSAIPVVDREDGRRLVGIVTRDGLFRAIRHRAALRT